MTFFAAHSYFSRQRKSYLIFSQEMTALLFTYDLHSCLHLVLHVFYQPLGLTQI